MSAEQQSHRQAPRSGADARYVVRFDDPVCESRALVGGKATNLGKLARAGMPVPPGYVVTTDAFSAALAGSGLGQAIGERAATLDYGDVATLEAQTEEIRALILEAPLPDAVASAITEAYNLLGEQGYVAVRSSATAEDMEDASFAGLHDTFLDVRGAAEVLSAVRMCWASLWTARCAVYRHRQGIASESAVIAVAVQRMVESEVAGVLFTANPLTAATDELVINASYGLGEGVVSGILTPDELVVDKATKNVRSRTLGAKEREVIRHPSGVGTHTVDVARERRERPALSDAQVGVLADLGARVTELYGGLPQDIEWAYADGSFSLLQTRAITGVEFVWDEDVDGWQTAPDDDDIVWTHSWAEIAWTGAITPLFYSIRAHEFRDLSAFENTLWGFDEIVTMRRYKYRRATMYYSSAADRLLYRYILPPKLRVDYLHNLPPAWREEAAAAPFDWWKALRMHVRIRRSGLGLGPLQVFDKTYEWIARADEADGPSPDALRAMRDDELEAAAAAAVAFFKEWDIYPRAAFFVYAPMVFGTLKIILARWYPGDGELAFQQLISGLPKRTAAFEESLDLWNLANRITRSDELRVLIERHSGADFFAVCEASEAGRAFLEAHRAFVRRWPHRGQADRDIWYERRSDNPAIDYQPLKLLAGGTPSPEEAERELIARRTQVTREVLASLRMGPFGWLRARACRWLVDYSLRFLALRDDQREFTDRITLRKKHCFAEVGRRLVERGKLHGDDCYFLAEHELWQLFHGGEATPLVRAKIEGRRRVFHRALAREETAPPYLQGKVPVDLDASDVDDGPVLRGRVLSRGVATGRARVVRSLQDIGCLEAGDILICNATDPGWTAAFALIRGLVIETGGLLAHGACLSREYGIPAVTLPRAIQRVPDGATITIDGMAGEITVLASEDPMDDDHASASLAR